MTLMALMALMTPSVYGNVRPCRDTYLQGRSGEQRGSLFPVIKTESREDRYSGGIRYHCIL